MMALEQLCSQPICRGQKRNMHMHLQALPQCAKSKLKAGHRRGQTVMVGDVDWVGSCLASHKILCILWLPPTKAPDFVLCLVSIMAVVCAPGLAE